MVTQEFSAQLVMPTVFVMLSVCCGRAQDPNFRVVGRVDLREETVTLTQELDIDRLVPGVENQIALVLKNNLKEDLTLVGITASCGCVAAEPIDGKLAPGEEVLLRINLRSVATSDVVGRALKIVDDQKRTWQVGMSCRNIDLFEPFPESLVFEKTDTVSRFKVRIKTKGDGMKLLRETCGPDACDDLKAKRLGVIVEKIQLLEEDEGLLLELDANPRSIELLGESQELIEIHNLFFKSQVMLSFRTPLVPRISPKIVSRYRLAEGVQRVMAFNIDPKKHNVAFRMRNEQGEFVEIEATPSGKSNRVLVYNLTLSPELTETCSWIEVYDKDDSEVVFSKMEVVE